MSELEQSYRRVLRLLPGYYREKWEEDMVTAFLESSLTGDPEEDEFTAEFGRTSWPEVASVAGLAARLYLGGAGAPHRYFAWGQAVRRAVLTVMLVHAVRALGNLAFLAWAHGALGWLPAPPPHVLAAVSDGIWTTVWYAVGYAWLVVFIALSCGYYRSAQVIAVLAIVPDLIYLLQLELTHDQPSHIGWWAYWFLLDLAPVLAMAAFHRDAPPLAPRPWLLWLLAGFALVAMPVLVIEATGHDRWLPDFPGLCCVLVTLACLAHAPRAYSRHAAGSGTWSLALTLLAAIAGLNRIASLGDYPHDSSMLAAGVVQLLVMAAAAALIVPDGARAQAAVSASAPSPSPG
jgi:hypothetical protein